jgi:outer membrane protein TolC
MSGVPEDQYQVAVEVAQTLWDGGVIRTQGKLRAAAADADRAQVDVDLYTLDRRVDQIFFSILLINARLGQNSILQDELKTSADRVASYIANGIATKPDADAIEVERVEALQNRIELNAQLRTYLSMLASLIGEPVASDTAFAAPSETASTTTEVLRRPELALFDARRDLILKRKSAAVAADSPRLSAFFQGLYGDPSLDTSETGADRDHIFGVRLTWNLGSLYTLPGTLKELDAERELLEADREAFLINADLDARKAVDEIEKIRALIEGDREIIALRARLEKSGRSPRSQRNARGRRPAPELDAENLAVQMKLLHEIQLQMAIRELNTLVKG